MKSIGEVYFDSSFFIDEASKTIGQAIVGNSANLILSNRRHAQGRLSAEGQIILSKILEEIENLLPEIKVKAIWERYCGCSMCPCSPGYRIKIDKDIRSTEKYRFSLHIKKDGSMSFRRPEFTYEIGHENVIQLEKTFNNEQ